MTREAVAENQFESIGEVLFHRPTGAKFAVHPSKCGFRWVDWGLAGETMPDGQYFDRFEVGRIAAQIVVSVLQSGPVTTPYRPASWRNEQLDNPKSGSMKQASVRSSRL
jgi:hypothetical protein